VFNAQITDPQIIQEIAQTIVEEYREVVELDMMEYEEEEGLGVMRERM